MHYDVTSGGRMRDDGSCADDSFGTGGARTAALDRGTAAAFHQSIRISVAVSARLCRRLRQCDRPGAPRRNAIWRGCQLSNRLAGRHSAVPEEIAAG